MKIKHYDDKNIEVIDIGYRQTDTSTGLFLYGVDSINYGEGIISNFVHLLENFANNEFPSTGTIGQFFYHSIDKLLYYYNKKKEWVPIENKFNKDPIDVVHFDIPSNHSNRQLANDLVPYMLKTGNSTPAKISLFDNDANLDNQAVTKGYVDSVLTKDATLYVPKEGVARMSGSLLLGDTTSSSDKSALVNKKYVDGLGKIQLLNEQYNLNSDITKLINIMTYKVTGMVDEAGKNIDDPWFIHVTFNTSILNSRKDVQINLPFSFVETGVADNNFKYSMSVVANSINTFTPLRVNVSSGSSFTIYRDNTKDKLDIHGMIMGFVKANDLPLTLPENQKPNRNPKNFLLAVGINEYDYEKNNLKGALNDVKNMVETFKYIECETYQLTDKQATKKNIISQLSNIIANAIEGDKIFFTFSGHGGTITTATPGAKIGEFLFLYGCSNKENTEIYYDNCLYDFEFLDIVNKSPVPVECFIDCCYSGGFSLGEQSQLGQSRFTSVVGDKVILWTASSKSQEASEISINDTYQGLFTYAFAYEAGGWSLTRSQTLNKMKEWITDYCTKNNIGLVLPELYCNPVYKNRAINDGIIIQNV